jgi:hypothetical protein
MRERKFKNATAGLRHEEKRPSEADLFLPFLTNINPKPESEKMPTSKKNLKLRDQKPAKDPKGGRRGHHGHHKAEATIAGAPRERRNPFDERRPLL